MKGLVKGGVMGGVKEMVADLAGTLKKEIRLASRHRGGANADADPYVDADVDPTVEAAKPKGFKEKAVAAFKQVTEIIPLPNLIVLLVLLFSLLLNFYFLAFSGGAPAVVVVSSPLNDTSSSLLSAELSRIIDISNDSITWSSIEQQLQEKSYILLRGEVRDMKRDIIHLYNTLNGVEERLMQAQVVNHIVDKVKDCQAKQSLRQEHDTSLEPQEEGCLRIEFLLREFFRRELEKAPHPVAQSS